MRGVSALRWVATTGVVVLGGCYYEESQPRQQPVPMGYYAPAPMPQAAPLPPSLPPATPAAELPPAPPLPAAPAPEPVQPIVQNPPSEAVANGFYSELSPYGQWVIVGGYGRCWRPAGVAVTWRPYTVGHWVYADCGWTWISEEPFGYATCHYGRWFLDARYGWIWVPGSVWAPAWVAWRSGGGYIGWAPLGPSVGVEVTEYYTRSIPAAQFCFVREREIVEPHIHQHMLDVRQNVTVISVTTNTTRITVVNNRVVNRSMAVEQVERATGRRIERVKIREVASVEEARRTGEVAVYRPKALPPAPRLAPAPQRREVAPIRPPQPERPQPQPPERPRTGRETVAPAKPAAAKAEQPARPQPGQVKPPEKQRPAAPAASPAPARNQQKPAPAKPDDAERKAAQARADAARRGGAGQDHREKADAGDAPGQRDQGGPQDRGR
jgi:hypothetical protein